MPYEMDYIKAVMEHHEEMSKSYITLGEYFYNISQRELYKPKFRTFTEYTYSLPFASSYASRLHDTYKKFIVEYKFTPQELMYVNMSVLFDLLPIVHSRIHADHWINLALTNTRTDLRNEIHKHKNDLLKVKKFSTGKDLQNKK